MWAFNGGDGREALEKIVAKYLKERGQCGQVKLDGWDIYECIKRFAIEHKLCCSYLFDSYSVYGGSFGHPNAYDAWRDYLESEINTIVYDCHGKILSSIDDVKPYLYQLDDLVVSEDEVNKQLLGECICEVLKHEQTGVEVYEHDGHLEFIDKSFCARCIEEYIAKRQLCCECLFDRSGYFDLRNKIKLSIPDVLEKLAEKHESVRKHDPKHDPNPSWRRNISYSFCTKPDIIERVYNHELTEFF